MTHSGKCLCGSVTFTATPKSTGVGVCHCGICRKNNAGPYFALDCGDTLKLGKSSDIGIYNSSEWAERVFCKSCGSSVAWRLKDGSMNHVPVDLFDKLDGVRLDHEVYIDHKPGYYSFAEDTQKMTEADILALFAGGQES